MPRHKIIDPRPLSVDLEDGAAEYMGDGLFLISQKDEETEELYRTVISVEDMRRMNALINMAPPVDLGHFGLSARATGQCL